MTNATLTPPRALAALAGAITIIRATVSAMTADGRFRRDGRENLAWGQRDGRPILLSNLFRFGTAVVSGGGATYNVSARAAARAAAAAALRHMRQTGTVVSVWDVRFTNPNGSSYSETVRYDVPGTFPIGDPSQDGTERSVVSVRDSADGPDYDRLATDLDGWAAEQDRPGLRLPE